MGPHEEMPTHVAATRLPEVVTELQRNDDGGRTWHDAASPVMI